MSQHFRSKLLLIKLVAATAMVICFSAQADAQRRINPVPPVGWTEHPEVVYPSGYRRTVQAVPTVQRIYMWPQYWPGVPYQTQAEYSPYEMAYPVMEDSGHPASPMPTPATPPQKPHPAAPVKPVAPPVLDPLSLHTPPVPRPAPITFPVSQPRELPADYLLPLNQPQQSGEQHLAPVILPTSAHKPASHSVLQPSSQSHLQPPIVPSLNVSNVWSTPFDLWVKPAKPSCGDPVE
ncbi:hypothetical protein GC197_08915 [bacterium]|nr:hypothetical protein [bacterium]